MTGMELIKKRCIFVYIPIFCATLFFVFPLTTVAQTVNIPDANLRAIEAALDKTSGATITAEDMATFTTGDFTATRKMLIRK